MKAKLTLLLGTTLLLAGVLAGCTDNGGEESATDPGANGECENRNLIDDDVMADDDGTTLGDCEENAADR